MRERVIKFLTEPLDALTLRVFEVLFVGAFVFRMGRNFRNWKEWLTDWGIRPTAQEYLSMGYPHPAPTLPDWGVPILAILLFGSAFCIMWPLRVKRPWWLLNRRFALWLITVCAFYVQAVDYMGSFAYNKIFIGVFTLLATGPGPYKDEAGNWRVSAAMLRMLQLTLITLYFSSGIAKSFRGDWLTHNDVLWTHVQGFHRTELAAWMLRTLPKWAWTPMQHSALFFELLAPIWFLVPKLRWATIAYGLIFHLLIALLMAGLIFFSLQMWSFYALFVTAKEWRFMGGKFCDLCGRIIPNRAQL